MSRKCSRFEALIDRREAGLDPAEQLVLEAHLSECGECRQTAAMLSAVTRAIAEADAPLTELAQRRAIERALNARPASVFAFESQQPWRMGLLAAAAAVLVGWISISAWRQTPSAERITTVEPSASPDVAKNEATQVAEAAHAEPRETDFGGAEREVRQFAHATVEIDAGSRGRFDADSRTIMLTAGQVRVDVDASRGQSFQVETEHFVVHVLGTLFTVTPEGVSVERGLVKVLGREGEVLASGLTAGQAYVFEHEAQRPRPQPRVTARGWLKRARAAMAKGDVEAARELIVQAEESDPNRSDRAEAGTLRAECALLSRDVALAVQHYLSVADRYADLRAGENAAFAAAQIAMRQKSQKPSARELFGRYLARYPHGRFAQEAKAQLGR